jgi:hypothetical protein
VVPLTGSEDPRLHTLAQVTAALNTDLEGAVGVECSPDTN